MEHAICVGEEDPGVGVERLLKSVDVALVEAVYVQLDDAHDFVVITGTLGHAGLLFSGVEPPGDRQSMQSTTCANARPQELPVALQHEMLGLTRSGVEDR